MARPVSATSDLATHIVDEVDRIVKQAEQSGQPLEVDPARSRLFELFVTADAAGYLDEESDPDPHGGFVPNVSSAEGVSLSGETVPNKPAVPDLTADGLCALLSEQWGLREATVQSTAHQTRLPPEQLQRMRSLWSVMRMWMEWNYAWSRWDEFHNDAQAR